MRPFMSGPGLRNDDPWYVMIVATRVAGQRSYTTAITTRDITKLAEYIQASSPPLISRCIAHPIGSSQNSNGDQPLFEGDDYADTESDDGALEEEAQVKEDIAHQYSEIQQIQLNQQQQPTGEGDERERLIIWEPAQHGQMITAQRKPKRSVKPSVKDTGRCNSIGVGGTGMDLVWNYPLQTLPGADPLPRVQTSAA